MKKKEIEKERDLLIAQLHDVQERLEELYIESGENYKRIAESEAVNASLKEKLDSTASELDVVGTFSALSNLTIVVSAQHMQEL